MNLDNSNHVNAHREPRNGDLVVVEVIRYGSRERLLRRYDQADGTITLTDPDGREPAIMRWRGEVHVVGVVESRSESLCGPDTS